MLSKDGKGQLRKACFYLSQEVKGNWLHPQQHRVMLESGNPIVRYDKKQGNAKLSKAFQNKRDMENTRFDMS